MALARQNLKSTDGRWRTDNAACRGKLVETPFGETVTRMDIPCCDISDGKYLKAKVVFGRLLNVAIASLIATIASRHNNF